MPESEAAQAEGQTADGWNAEIALEAMPAQTDDQVQGGWGAMLVPTSEPAQTERDDSDDIFVLSSAPPRITDELNERWRTVKC